MIGSNFLTSQQRDELKAVVRRPSETHGIARGANAILLLDDDKNCEEIAKLVYLDDDTIRQWFKQYHSGGFDNLATFDWKGRTAHLNCV